MTTDNENYWWAEPTKELEGFPWSPSLQTDHSCFSLPIHFATKEECEAFIAEEIVGAGYASQD